MFLKDRQTVIERVRERKKEGGREWGRERESEWGREGGREGGREEGEGERQGGRTHLYLRSFPSVWADSLVLTRSRGYVAVTDATPASAPAHNLLPGVCCRGSEGIFSSCGKIQKDRKRETKTQKRSEREETCGGVHVDMWKQSSSPTSKSCDNYDYYQRKTKN